MNSVCKDCQLYKGDCGNHFVDRDEHIHYDVPNEVMYDGVFSNLPKCFEMKADIWCHIISEKCPYSGIMCRECELFQAINRAKAKAQIAKEKQ